MYAYMHTCISISKMNGERPKIKSRHLVETNLQLVGGKEFSLKWVFDRFPKSTKSEIFWQKAILINSNTL